MLRFKKNLTLFAVLCFAPLFLLASEGKLSRLLVSIDPSASFSPEEFASTSSATLLKIETRNPYKVVEKVFLEEPFVVLSEHLVTNDYGWGSKVLEHLSARYGYRYVVFTNETLDEATKISRQLLSTNPKYSSQLTKLSIEESTRLYSLMEKIDKVLTKHNVKYWAGRETLLGAVRHGGLLPWDDYLHLFITDTDNDKLQTTQAAFEEEGLVLHSYFKDFYKVCEADGLPLEDHFNKDGGLLPFTYPAANIFILSLEKRNEVSDVYVHRSFNFYFNWNHDRFDYSQIQNIRKVPFGPVTIAIPGSPEEYLNRLYGSPKDPELWKTHSIELLWDHRREDNTAYPGAVLVEVDTFTPAPWK